MNKNLFLLTTILFFVCYCCVGQENRIDRKGRFYFSLGPEYRITPFYKFSPTTRNARNFSAYTNIDKQNSGTAVKLDIEYFITKKLGLGFSNSFRYDLVISEFTNIDGLSGVKEADYKLLFDYNIYLTYYFKVFSKGEFFVNAGVSLMNRNSEFSVKEPIVDQTGTIVGEIYTIADFNYFANRISIGYKNKIGKIFLGIYTTQLTPYFDVNTRFNVPFIGCSFDIGKL